MDNQSQASAPNKYLPLLLGLCTAIGLVVGLNIPRYDKHVAVHQTRAAGGGNNLLSEVLGYIDAKYVDGVDSLEFDETAIKALLAKLDPHTSYLSPDAVAQVTEEMDGSFKGIGIEFLMVNDTLQVITPIAGGPSEAAGIWSGDQFLQVDETPIAGVQITDDQLFKLLRGDKGTSVQVLVKRGQEAKLRTFTILRDEIPVHSVTAAYLLDSSTVYVKLARFNSNTHQEFVDAVLPFTENRAKAMNLVLDLRGNPGGLLDQAVQVLSDLFPKDKLLVYTEGRADKKRNYNSSGRSQINVNKLSVLIDEGSASASEVVAGAIQDHDRGWIIGERSYGKGLVQEQFPLSNGGALRVTVSRYFTPSGRCIQKDYTNRKSYADEHLRRQDTTQVVDNQVYYTGRGRKVYGSKGITPDVTVKESDLERSATFGRARSMMSGYVTKWMEGRPKAQFPTEAEAFARTYDIGTDLGQAFYGYTVSQGVQWTATEYNEYRDLIQAELKAALARNLYGTVGYQRVKNQHDAVVKAALAQLEKEILPGGQLPQ